MSATSSINSSKIDEADSSVPPTSPLMQQQQRSLSPMSFSDDSTATIQEKQEKNGAEKNKSKFPDFRVSQTQPPLPSQQHQHLLLSSIPRQQQNKHQQMLQRSSTSIQYSSPQLRQQHHHHQNDPTISTTTSRTTPPTEPRRRSTRDIKKPKFDDELVESGAPPLLSHYHHHQHQQQQQQHAIKTTPTPKRRQASTGMGTSSGGGGGAHPVNGASSIIGAEEQKLQWAPEDDVALIASATHVIDLWIVYHQMPFTKRYSLEQIEERWYELLYDEHASSAARKRMEQMERHRIVAIQERIPFSMAEEQLLRQIPSNAAQPVTPLLLRILEQHRDSIFHYARSVRSLEEHWRELRLYGLLVDQKPLQTEEDTLTFDLLSLASTGGEAAAGSEMLPMDVEERQFARNMSICERETREWEGGSAAVITSSIVGIMPGEPSMSAETVGLFCGRCTTFDVRKERVLIGRSTRRHNVEVNLTLEGPTAYISRKQAIFKLTDSGGYLLRNIGKRHINVNGRAVLQGEAIELPHNSLVEIALIRLKFLKNVDYKKKMTSSAEANNPSTSSTGLMIAQNR